MCLLFKPKRKCFVDRCLSFFFWLLCCLSLFNLSPLAYGVRSLGKVYSIGDRRLIPSFVRGRFKEGLFKKHVKKNNEVYFARMI